MLLTKHETALNLIAKTPTIRSFLLKNHPGILCQVDEAIRSPQNAPLSGGKLTYPPRHKSKLDEMIWHMERGV